MAAGRVPRYFRERKKNIDIYDNDELLERYRFNMNKIVYITDLLHKESCPLTGRSQSIDTLLQRNVICSLFGMLLQDVCDESLGYPFILAFLCNLRSFLICRITLPFIKKKWSKKK